MTAIPPEQWDVEVLLPPEASATASTESGTDVIVEFGSVSVVGHPEVPEVVEVASFPPVGGGYDRVEVLAFTKQGTLAITPSTSEFPIAGGNFRLESIAARVKTAPVGGSVVLDVLKNGVSIFSVSADRPTIAEGQKVAVTGDYGSVMFAEGDYLEVIIVSVGTTNPGATLTASVRLTRIG